MNCHIKHPDLRMTKVQRQEVDAKSLAGQGSEERGALIGMSVGMVQVGAAQAVGEGQQDVGEEQVAVAEGELLQSQQQPARDVATLVEAGIVSAADAIIHQLADQVAHEHVEVRKEDMQVGGSVLFDENDAVLVESMTTDADSAMVGELGAGEEMDVIGTGSKVSRERYGDDAEREGRLEIVLPQIAAGVVRGSGHQVRLQGEVGAVGRSSPDAGEARAAMSDGDQRLDSSSDEETLSPVGNLPPCHQVCFQEGNFVSAAGALDSSVVVHKPKQKGIRALFPSDRQLRSNLINSQNSSHALLNDLGSFFEYSGHL